MFYRRMIQSHKSGRYASRLQLRLADEKSLPGVNSVRSVRQFKF